MLDTDVQLYSPPVVIAVLRIVRMTMSTRTAVRVASRDVVIRSADSPVEKLASLVSLMKSPYHVLISWTDLIGTKQCDWQCEHQRCKMPCWMVSR